MSYARMIEWPRGVEEILYQDANPDWLLLAKPSIYEQQLVHYIDDVSGELQQNLVHSIGFYILLSQSEKPKTIKVEGVERASPQIWKRLHEFAGSFGRNNAPISAHLFIAKAGSPSFPMHTDYDDVHILCLDGIKTMEVMIDGEPVVFDIKPGECLYIPHGVEHRALNTYDSTMLSIGFDRYLIDRNE